MKKKTVVRMVSCSGRFGKTNMVSKLLQGKEHFVIKKEVSK